MATAVVEDSGSAKPKLKHTQSKRWRAVSLLSDRQPQIPGSRGCQLDCGVRSSSAISPGGGRCWRWPRNLTLGAQFRREILVGSTIWTLTLSVPSRVGFRRDLRHVTLIRPVSTPRDSPCTFGSGRPNVRLVQVDSTCKSFRSATEINAVLGPRVPPKVCGTTISLGSTIFSERPR